LREGRFDLREAEKPTVASKESCAARAGEPAYGCGRGAPGATAFAAGRAWSCAASFRRGHSRDAAEFKSR
jgi:hypothetical protein